jgi:hypothetical protein
MNNAIGTTFAALWLVGCTGNMALFAGTRMTTSDRVIASAPWPVGLIAYLDRKGLAP